ncbi:hypothetical protein GCM10010869_60960 [Mesorhizobium tianshanense]|nr:hypothetical protein GCM10010869_60960 [Mesorhizobium tianshanense]
MRCQRQAAKRHQRVVQVEQQLAPQHRCHVAVLGYGKPVDIEEIDEASYPVFDHHLAFAGAMHAKRQFATRRLDHVERHHAGEHKPPGEPGPQPVGIVDAVLQADHHRVRAGMGGNERRHLLRRAALDRYQDHFGTGQGDRRIGGDRSCISPDEAVTAIKVGDPQPMLPQGLANARPSQQNHLPSGERQATAGIATNAAGSGNDDRFILVGHPIVLPWPATIRHETIMSAA